MTGPSTRVPEAGLGSYAGFGARFLAFLIDGVVLANLLAIAIDGGHPNNDRHTLLVYGSFLLIELVFVTLAGQTPGMWVAGIAVLRADGRGKPALGWVAVRTVLIVPVVTALITDGQGRTLHDRAAGTTTVRVR